MKIIPYVGVIMNSEKELFTSELLGMYAHPRRP